MAIQTRRSYCRLCHNYCPLEVDIEDGRAVAVRGNASDPIYGGYTCIKGRQLPALHAHPMRLLRPHKRQPDGSFEEISSRQALDEIADHIARIVDEFGPRAVASYCGTYAFQNCAALAVAKAPPAAAPLRPAGRADFGKGPLDVVSSGAWIAAGGQVRVVEVHGSRVVVEEA